MSPVYLEPEPHTEHSGPLVRKIDDKRGTFGMILLICTEATLFAMMFFVYFFVAKGNERWKIEEPPKLHYALPMLAILLTSSGVLYWGEKQLEKLKINSARVALVGTIILGFGFLGMSYFDFTEHLLHLTPTTDAYGSAFYTLTSIHGLHVCLGLLMLIWMLLVGLRERHWEPTSRYPHRPYHNVALYWHFVDTVWIFIVAILYVAPNVYKAL